MLTGADVRREFDAFARSYDELPEHVKRLEHPDGPNDPVRDYPTYMRNGWRWMLEGMQRRQPATFATIEAGNPSMLFASGRRSALNRSIWRCSGLLQLGERYLVFEPEIAPDYRLETEREDHPAWSRFVSLPEAIAEAWYARFDRLDSVLFGRRVLPVPISSWTAVPSAIYDVDGDSKRAVRLLKSVGIKPNSALIFLDTTTDGMRAEDGARLVVVEGNTRREVLHMRGLDPASLRVLKTPGEALDEYVAHVLTGSVFPFHFDRFLGPAIFT